MSALHIVAVAAALALAGCVSPAAQHAADRARCSQYGFVLGADAFAHCMMSSDMNRQYQNAAAQRATNLRIDEQNAEISDAFRAKMNADQASGSSN